MVELWRHVIINKHLHILMMIKSLQYGANQCSTRLKQKKERKLKLLSEISALQEVKSRINRKPDWEIGKESLLSYGNQDVY